MSSESNLPFAQRISQSRSIQGVARALGIFAKRFPGHSKVTLEHIKLDEGQEGTLTNFEAPESSGEIGHEIFLDILEKTERLQEIEVLLSSPSMTEAEATLLKEEGAALVEKLYGVQLGSANG